uniref:Uncharacterized protein n=1 Tax=Schistosoma curassoni TaxID=6186 RepID=A0A183KUJ1_9TREM
MNTRFIINESNYSISKVRFMRKKFFRCSLLCYVVLFHFF